MCMPLRGMASAILQATFWSPRTPTDSKRGDDAEVTADDAEEGAIVHALTCQAAPRTNRVKFVATVDSVQVSLALGVSARRDASSGLLLQQATATWAFSAANERSQLPVEFIDDPIHAFELVTSSLFKAYAANRLQFSAHRHAEWATGSSLSLTPRVVSNPATMVMKELVRTASKLPQQQGDENCVHGHAAKKTEKKLRLPRSAGINPRYLDYENTLAYSTRRQGNLERRHALERNQRTTIPLKPPTP
ncbi:hypothetical protein PHYPSEUDO_003630 [Phytophthora pseudosyringae]|uniref:Uncharacterized protein n=1 Tax=Phytophthora pseudosyringae TaxID=221518 RepID=A0A8T1VTB7_9STRA|nr:hypothetical protein PHYPSEUDO_003630 [Phytophthora pseudosyringae]